MSERPTITTPGIADLHEARRRRIERLLAEHPEIPRLPRIPEPTPESIVERAVAIAFARHDGRTAKLYQFPKRGD